MGVRAPSWPPAWLASGRRAGSGVSEAAGRIGPPRSFIASANCPPCRATLGGGAEVLASLTARSLEACQPAAPWGAVPSRPQPVTPRRPAAARSWYPTPSLCSVSLTPTHGSSAPAGGVMVEGLARRLLKRGADAAVRRFRHPAVRLRRSTTPSRASLSVDSDGPPLVRATSLSQTRHQQRQGRAWVSPHPKPRFKG